MKKIILLGLLAVVVCAGTIIACIYFRIGVTPSPASNGSPTDIPIEVTIPPSNMPSSAPDSVPATGPTITPTVTPVPETTGSGPTPDPTVPVTVTPAIIEKTDIPDTDQYTMTIYSQGTAVLNIKDVTVNYTIYSETTTRNSFSKDKTEIKNAIYNLTGDIDLGDGTGSTKFSCTLKDGKMIYDLAENLPKEIADPLMAYTEILYKKPLNSNKTASVLALANMVGSNTMSGSASVTGSHDGNGKLDFTTTGNVVNGIFDATTNFTYESVTGEKIIGYIKGFRTKGNAFGYAVTYTNTQTGKLPDDVLSNLTNSIKKIYDETY